MLHANLWQYGAYSFLLYKRLLKISVDFAFMTQTQSKIIPYRYSGTYIGLYDTTVACNRLASVAQHVGHVRQFARNLRLNLQFCF